MCATDGARMHETFNATRHAFPVIVPAHAFAGRGVRDFLARRAGRVRGDGHRHGAARAWRTRLESRRSRRVHGGLRGRLAHHLRYECGFHPRAQRDRSAVRAAFEDLDADWIGPETVHVVAWYKLMRGDSLTARGPTSLVLIRERGQWVILKDHSG
jgi:hypothetical protein